MFTQRWREKWGLREDPFACEDADKDPILTGLDASVSHWGFDRIYGNPRVPAPAIIFGEKGSGKSALRLIVSKRLDDFNNQNPNDKAFSIEYLDYNPYIENFRRAIGSRNSESGAQEVVQRWKVSDHLDCILSIGITKLIDKILVDTDTVKNLTHKQRIYLLLITSLYYNSDRQTTPETMNKLTRLFETGSFYPSMRWIVAALGTLVSIGIFALPHLHPDLAQGFMSVNVWHALGLLGLIGTWGWFLYQRFSLSGAANRAVRAVKVLSINSANLKEELAALSSKERKEYHLPVGSDDSSRYHLLSEFMGILQSCGYQGVYVLVDRIDEPSLLSAREDLMRQFVEKMLDIKLLQYPRLGLKLFLPIELDEIYRNASPEDLKRMRLDKSNLINELQWGGQELYEISNVRLRTSLLPDSPVKKLDDFFETGFDVKHLKETLSLLGTPRYAFGFLSALFADHIKGLPNDLPDTDPAWKIDRHRFDIVRSAWIDRSGVLRRVLN